MAKKTKTLKGVGSRYGRTVRQRMESIRRLQKAKYKCPYCSAQKVAQESIGIWECKKCGAKFTGKAYTISKATKKGVNKT